MAFVVAELEAMAIILNVLRNTETEPGKHLVCQECHGMGWSTGRGLCAQ